MSLFMSLSSTDQFHSKPMAISSITSPMGRPKEPPSSAVVPAAAAAAANATTTPDYDVNDSPLLACASPSLSSAHSETITPPTAGSSSSKSGSSSPPSRALSNYSSSSSYSFPGSPNQNSSSNSANINLAKNTRSNSNNSLLPQPSIIAPSFYHPYHYSGNHSNSRSGSSSSTSSSSSSSTSNNAAVQAPLSIHERRLRNKTASAKYRAKKNQQYGEMRSMISSLTKENELLLRQLDHIQHENSHLKATCDRLRGKIMAQKMLKQYLVENEQQKQQQQQQQHPHQHQLNMEQSSNCFLQQP